MDPIITISNLTKTYGNVIAVDGFNLKLERGSIHGLVGPNGAGKTTMLSIMSGLRKKTTGEINIGVPIDRIMLMPDTPEFFDFLTTREVVGLARSPFENEIHQDEVDQVIKKVGLIDSKDRRVGGFSRGMKQRLGLAVTIIGNPKLIFLDEPCSALDPIGRRDVLDIISTLKENSTILFSTHILNDIESICDSVTVVDEGKTLYEGNISELTDTEGSFEDAVFQLLQPNRPSSR